MRLDRTRVLLLGWLLVLGADWFSLTAQTNQLDSDIRLFTVLTAINLAGYDDGLGSPSDSPVRQPPAQIPASGTTALGSYLGS